MNTKSWFNLLLLLFTAVVSLNCGKPKEVLILSGNWSIQNSIFIIDSTNTSIEKIGSLNLSTKESDLPAQYDWRNGTCSFEGASINGIPQNGDIIWSTGYSTDYGTKKTWHFSIAFAKELVTGKTGELTPKGYSGLFDVIENIKNKSYSFSGNLNDDDFSLPSIKWKFDLVKK